MELYCQYIHWEGVGGKNSMEHLSGTYSCFMLFHVVSREDKHSHSHQLDIRVLCTEKLFWRLLFVVMCLNPMFPSGTAR